MKRVSLFLLLFMIYQPSTISQEAPHLDFKKTLDSIIQYRFDPSGDSIKRDKTGLRYFDSKKHVEYKYFKWHEYGREWIPDYARLENRKDYFYDDEGKVLMESRSLWDSHKGSYTILSMLERDYDTNGWCVYEILKSWDMMGSDVRGHYLNYEYDAFGNVVFENKCEWIADVSNWWGKYQMEHTYNHDNKRTSTKWFTWNEEEREWSENIRNDWTYFEDGRLHKFIWYSWDSVKPGWDPGTMEEYSYDPDANSTLIISYHHDDVDQEWVETERMDQKYNIDNQLIETMVYLWDGTNNEWDEFYRENIEYDDNGFRLLFENHHWNTSTGKWEGSSKIEYDFDKNGNRLEYINYQNDPLTGDWIPDIKWENSYDESGNMNSGAQYSWDEVAKLWSGLEKKDWDYHQDGDLNYSSDYEWNDSSGAWDLCSRSFYYYEEGSSRNDLIYTDETLIYPNPSSGLIYIRGFKQASEIKILNISGQIVKVLKQPELIIDLSYLEPGIYMLIIEENDRSTISRLIKSYK